MFKNLSPEALGLSGRQSETIEGALSFGFKGIDLHLSEFAATVSSHGVAHARRLTDSAKLKLGGFALPVDLQQDDSAFDADLAKLAGLARIAADAGCTRCLTTIEPACDERAYFQNFEFHRQRLGKVAQTLDTAGVRLGVGFVAGADAGQGREHEFVRTFDALWQLLGLVGAKNVGVWLDVWQLRAGGGSLESLARLSADKIVAVQLADAAEDSPVESWTQTGRKLPGETGVIDSAAFLVWLAEKGYDGPVTPAPHPSRLAGMRRDAIVKLAGQQLDQVWKAAGLNAAGKLTTVKH